MNARLAQLCLSMTAVALFLTFSSAGGAQNALSAPPAVGSVELPDAPQPQQGQQTQPAPAAPDPSQQPSPAPNAAPQQTAPDTAKPAADTPQSAADEEKKRHDLAEQQIKVQQTQRVAGLLPNFNTSYIYNAVSLTASQKFKLAFRSATDPVQFLVVSPFVAGIGQAEGSHPAYGGGIGGYAKRYGQTYADSFNGAMIGNAILPAILHQDPRFFRLGRGSATRRLFYALGTNILCRHDVTGKWEPNYSNVLGNLASGGISNLYLPKGERGFESTITGGFTVTAEGGAGSLLQEFWPDFSRKYLHKDPTHGQDAINAMKPDPTGGGNPFSNHRHETPEPASPPQNPPSQQ